jgi:hypothetical protein
MTEFVSNKNRQLVMAAAARQQAIANAGLQRKATEAIVHGTTGGAKGRKWSTDSLAYPMNVESDMQQGHHIIFEIMKQNKAKIEANKIENRRAAMVKMLGAGGDPEAGGVPKKSKPSPGATGRKKNNSVQLSRPATVAMDTCIALYMPPSVKVQYAARYGEANIGLMAEAGMSAIEAFMQGGDAKTTAMGMLNNAETGVKNMAMAAIEAVAPGAKALLAISEGMVVTPKIELMFESIGRRNFSFEFNFLPKSEQEAIVVEEIVYKFKYHMASNYSTGAEGVRKMEIPDHFNIRYMYRNNENFHLNRISTCVLKDLSVDYGGDRFVAYAGGRPQSTKISLTFEELEIITKNDIALGY